MTATTQRKKPRTTHRIHVGRWVRVERGDDGVIRIEFPEQVWPERERGGAA